MQTTTPAAPLSLEQETNPWLAQAARFDEAAKRLNLEPGIWKVLRYPSREIIVHIQQPAEHKVSLALTSAQDSFVHSGLQLAEIGVALDAPLAFQIKVMHDGIELECYPETAPIQFRPLGQDFALQNWIV